jgi:hypothetical protein
MLRALNLGVDVFLAGNWLTYDLELPRRWAAMIEQAILQHQLAEQRLVEAGERVRVNRMKPTSSLPANTAFTMR